MFRSIKLRSGEKQEVIQTTRLHHQHRHHHHRSIVKAPPPPPTPTTRSSSGSPPIYDQQQQQQQHRRYSRSTTAAIIHAAQVVAADGDNNIHVHDNGIPLQVIVDDSTHNNKKHHDGDESIQHSSSQVVVSHSCCWVWKIQQSLPIVPLDVPLERTAIEIKLQQSAGGGGNSFGGFLDIITARISTFMKTNSISVKYRCHDVRGTSARVDCLTLCGLKFVVQLWKSTLSDFDSIVLEVQRRRGCSITMRSIRKLLYKAVLQNDLTACYYCRHSMAGTVTTATAAATAVTGTPQQDTTLPVSSKRRQNSFESQTLAAVISHSCIDVSDEKQQSQSTVRPLCLDLLTSKRRDENRLGLETLLVLANPNNRVGRENAEAIAHGLAFGIPEEFGSHLRSIFLSFLCPSLSMHDDTREDINGSSYDVASLQESSMDDFRERQDLQLLSLKVLSTCLDNIMEKEEDYLSNEAMMLDLASNFWSQTIQTLLDRLEDCSNSPHEAAWAAKCLRTLEILQPDLLNSTD